MEGKAGLVTGAGSGIGRAGAIAFANHGGKVVVSDYNEASGHGTVALIKEAGGRAEFLRCDVSDEEQVKARRALISALSALAPALRANHPDCAMQNHPAGRDPPMSSAAECGTAKGGG